MNEPTISDAVRTICSKHWKLDYKGYPAKDCCRACPIMTACHRNAATYADIMARRVALNEAANGVQ